LAIGVACHVPDATVPKLVNEDPVTPAASAAPVNVLAAAATVQLPPSVQLCPFTVVPLFASAAFGIEFTATDSVGVVPPFATLGVIHAGQFPAKAVKLVTVPLDKAVPQSLSVPFVSAKQTASFAVVPAVGPVANPAPPPATLARADIGIGLEATESVGIDVALPTLGTSQEGQPTAAKPVTVPDAGAEPQSVSVPNSSPKQAASFATLAVGPVMTAAPFPLGAPPSVRVCGDPPPHSARCPAVGVPATTGTFPPLRFRLSEPPLNAHARVEGLYVSPSYALLMPFHPFACTTQ